MTRLGIVVCLLAVAPTSGCVDRPVATSFDAGGRTLGWLNATEDEGVIEHGHIVVSNAAAFSCESSSGALGPGIWVLSVTFDSTDVGEARPLAAVDGAVVHPRHGSIRTGPALEIVDDTSAAEVTIDLDATPARIEVSGLSIESDDEAFVFDGDVELEDCRGVLSTPRLRDRRRRAAAFRR